MTTPVPTPVSIVDNTQPSQHPTPVSIVSPAPLPVEITGNGTLVPPSTVPVTVSGSPAPVSASTDIIAREAHMVKVPTTTAEEEKHSLGQRRVNLIWEYTQAFIAISVVVTLLVAIAISVLRGDPINAMAIAEKMAILIIGFYFGRTNHQRVGGVSSGR